MAEKVKENIEKSEIISVIIPVYNVELYLGKCIHSVQNNTYRNLEIICVNDGSTDKCSKILEELAEKDSRIVMIHQENQGVAAARNAGLNAATGEFIAFIDSDDFIHPRYFETMLHCMKNKNSDVVVCGCRKFNENENIEIPHYQQISYKRINDQKFFSHYYTRHMIWGRLYHKKDLEGIRFTADVRMADDTLYNLRVVSRINRPVVYETNAELYYYLMRENSIVHTEKAERIGDTGSWYLSNRQYEREYSGRWGWMLPMQVIKATLSYRYMVRYIHRADDKVKEANRILRIAYKDLFEIKKNTIIEYFLLFIMINSPRLYRAFRLLQDPSMLDWEKKQKGRKKSVA